LARRARLRRSYKLIETASHDEPTASRYRVESDDRSLGLDFSRDEHIIVKDMEQALRWTVDGDSAHHPLVELG